MHDYLINFCLCTTIGFMSGLLLVFTQEQGNQEI